jgi:hypothetical protein
MMIIWGMKHILTLYFEDTVRLRQPDNDNLAPVTMAEYAPDEGAFPSGLLTLY